MTSRVLPSGTLTFFFSDIEGSTRLVQRFGAGFREIVEEHARRIRAALAAAGGVEVRTIGDAFFVVFPTADGAVAAAIDAQRSLAEAPWPEGGEIRCRIGLHTGVGELGGDDYVGIDVHRAARIAAVGYGGQILVSQSTRDLVGAHDLRDLGEHRLKDVGSLRLWQVRAPGLPEAFPPLASLETPSNLPTEATPFIGRDREVTQLRDLVRRNRLVTLTGPGGTGKTRLSLHVARDILSEFPNGVYFVPLAPVREPAIVPTTIAQVLSVREEPGRPMSDLLKDRLRDLTTLLVLDNFERVIDAAPLVGELLAAAPGLTCLASSREALRVYGEHEYPVPTLSEDDAVALFVERARMVRPAFELDDQNDRVIRAICARLDRLPLAIELAAARIKVFAPNALLSRLHSSLGVLNSGSRDLSERQRTLRGAIAWSHDLIGEDERAVFRRAAVFVNGCRVEAAEMVCDPEGELGSAVVDDLESLVDKSLLRSGDDAGETRFDMLETIREYGLERLAESGEGSLVRRRHAEWVLALVESAEAALSGGEDAPWLMRLACEHDNIRAALDWAERSDAPGIGLRISGATWRFWQQRGFLAEGRARLERMLGLPAATPPGIERAKGLTALAGLAYWQGDFSPLDRAYSEALEIYRRLGPPGAIAEAIFNASFVQIAKGDLAAARAMLEEAIGIYDEIPDQTGVANANELLASLLYRQGRIAEAVEAEERVLAYRRGQPNRFLLSDTLNLYSLFLFDLGRVRDWHAAMRECLEIQTSTGNVGGAIVSLLHCARAAVRTGDPNRAARICGAVSVMGERATAGASPMGLLGIGDPEVEARRALDADEFAREHAAGRLLSFEEVTRLALGT
ncbi:MAG: adenylate/guanylate cyclase domain-containing protein [Candidatus Limnocylindria bacterium]